MFPVSFTHLTESYLHPEPASAQCDLPFLLVLTVRVQVLIVCIYLSVPGASFQVFFVEPEQNLDPSARLHPEQTCSDGFFKFFRPMKIT